MRQEIEDLVKCLRALETPHDLLDFRDVIRDRLTNLAEEIAAKNWTEGTCLILTGPGLTDERTGLLSLSGRWHIRKEHGWYVTTHVPTKRKLEDKLGMGKITLMLELSKMDSLMGPVTDDESDLGVIGAKIKKIQGKEQ
jgi:hypothetical protein